MFPISKCRGDWDLGQCTFWVLAERKPLRNAQLPQVSSMKSTTKLCRFLINDRRLTVILRRWIGTDHRWQPRCQPYSPVSESASTVDIDRDRSTGSINLWIGVDILIGVETISHHAWDHDFLVDVCPEPFHTTYGTIGQWSFFSTSRKNAVNRFFAVMNPHRRSISTGFLWNLWSMRYRSYFQEGESASTVNINRIFK